MAYLKTESGQQVHYVHYRVDDRRPAMVLIHGWGMSGDYWNSAVEALAASGSSSIVLDHRGCGASDRDFEDMSIEAIAQDVVDIVSECGVRAVVLNGWSLGGAVAVEAAHRLGNAVKGLVLTCGATPRYTQADDFPHGGKADDVAANGAAITADRANFFRTLAEGAVAEGASPALISWLERGFLASGPMASRTLMGLADLDQRAILQGFAFPVLSIGGAKDGIVDPDISRRAAEIAPHGRHLVLDTGHSPHLEEPAAYHQAITEFMETIA